MTDIHTTVTLGVQGFSGPPSVTSATASFVQPAVNASVNVSVGNTTWMVGGMPIFVQGGGSYTVTTTPAARATVVALTNVGGTANATPGATIASGALVAPSGPPGPAGTPPTGSGFAHVTAGSFDGSARAVDLGTADVTGTLPAGNQAAQTLGGALSGTTALATVNLGAGATVTGTLPAANQAAQAMGGAVGGTTAVSTISLTGNAGITGVLPAANQAAQALGGQLSGTTAAATVAAVSPAVVAAACGVQIIQIPIGTGASQSSVASIPASAVVFRRNLEIDVAFPGGTLIAGDAGNNQRLIATSDVDVTALNKYSFSDLVTWGNVASQLLVTIGGAPAQGSAVLTVFYGVPQT